MIQRGIVVQPADMMGEYDNGGFRLSSQELQELQETFGCNHGDSEVKESYFAEPSEYAELTILEEAEYFRMYGDGEPF